MSVNTIEKAKNAQKIAIQMAMDNDIPEREHTEYIAKQYNILMRKEEEQEEENHPETPVEENKPKKSKRTRRVSKKVTVKDSEQHILEEKSKNSEKVD